MMYQRLCGLKSYSPFRARAHPTDRAYAIVPYLRSDSIVAWHDFDEISWNQTLKHDLVVRGYDDVVVAIRGVCLFVCFVMSDLRPKADVHTRGHLRWSSEIKADNS